MCVVVPPVAPEEAAQRLTRGTEALGEWGRIVEDRIGSRRGIVALVGIGTRRWVVVARRRARATTYLALAAWVSGELDSRPPSRNGSTRVDPTHRGR